MRKGEMMFQILRERAERMGSFWRRCVRGITRWFGFLRAPEANYLPGPDDICIAESSVSFLLEQVTLLKV